jgi:hypothetical protein
MGAPQGYPGDKTTIPGTFKVQGVWTGGGAATNCTKAAADWSKGIASVNYTAATGCYTITFTDVGQQIVGWKITTGQQTGVNPLNFILRNGSFSATTKSVIIEVSADDSGTLTDLLTTDKLYIEFQFAKQAP